MAEKTIKKIMDERFGEIPRRQVSRAEMDKLLADAKERGKTKNKLTGREDEEEAEEEYAENFPCPTPAPSSPSDEVKEMVEPFNPVNEQITETGKNKELVYCEYRCNDCQEIVVACGSSLEKAKKLVAFHKECGGRLVFLRQVNPKVAENKERFSHPRVERAICDGCFHDMECPRTFQRMVLCLLSGIDYKMKKLRGG